MSTATDQDAWSVNRPFADRPLLDDDQSTRLAGIFKVLASPTRLRLLHALTRAGELRVTDLADRIGSSVQATSNQLQRLVDQEILAARREGTEMRYHIVDPCTPGLIDLAMCLVSQQEG